LLSDRFIGCLLVLGVLFYVLLLLLWLCLLLLVKWQEGLGAALIAQLLSQRLMEKEEDWDKKKELQSHEEYDQYPMSCYCLELIVELHFQCELQY